MTGYDQALMFMSAIGVGMMVVTFLLVRSQDQVERRIEAEKANRAHPAE